MGRDQEWLKDFIRRRTGESWNDGNRPYYLSFVGIDLARQEIDYRPIIAPLKLREWALTNSVPGTKVLADNVHKAKVAFVPEGVDFSFEEASNDTSAPANSIRSQMRQRMPRKAYLLVQFLQSLSSLSDEELDSVHIPVKILARLVKE